MASLAAQQLTGLRQWPQLPTSPLAKRPSLQHSFAPKKSTLVVSAAPRVISNAETKKRAELRKLFEDAYERCRTSPLEGLSFTFDEFNDSCEDSSPDSEIGTKVTGTVFLTDETGAYVDINDKAPAFLPVEEACIHRIWHVEEAGMVPGLIEEFLIVGEDEEDDSLYLSLKDLQYELAWERCKQLQTEDVIVKGQIVGGNRGGVVALVEGLRGFVPFSQITLKSTIEDLMDKVVPLKFVEVDQEQSRIVLSNRKAMADSQAQLGIGSVVTGTVQTLKPYGAFIDIGGINGLLHVSQISHDRVSDVATVLQPGDTLKVMILSHDRDRGRVSLSTKKLEPTPGDMIRNPELVFEKAEEMAQLFRQRIAQAEAMARADILRFQPESGLTLGSEGILGPLASDAPAESFDFSDIPPAEGFDLSEPSEDE